MALLGSLDKKVSRFYLYVWVKWALYVTFLSLFSAVVVAAFITVLLYYKQGAVALNDEVYSALKSIFYFWFAPAWSVTLLIALFVSLKSIFKGCYGNFRFILLTCPNEKTQTQQIEKVRFRDLIKVWRKWFMLLIWLVSAQIIVAVVVMKLFTQQESLFSWFNIYVLYAFILVGGYFSFIILGAKCKKIKIRKC